MEFEWIYCELCKTVTGICPECGNNCCNGGYGEDGKCKTCPKIYNLIAKSKEEGTIPSKNGLRILPDAFKKLTDGFECDTQENK